MDSKQLKGRHYEKRKFKNPCILQAPDKMVKEDSGGTEFSFTAGTTRSVRSALGRRRLEHLTELGTPAGTGAPGDQDCVLFNRRCWHRALSDK